MKGFTTYAFTVSAAILIAIAIGIFGPAMVSSRKTEVVILGFALVLLLPIGLLALWHLWRRSKEAKRIVKKIAPLLLLGIMLGACSKVPAGNVGVIVNLYGSDKGVSEQVVGVGRYWVGWNEELFVFPTFTQNDSWQQRKDRDESITFQTGKDGMVMSADFGITFRVDPTKVATLFQTYRKGIEEISDLYLRNLVRDAVNEKAAELTADEAYGRRKNEMMDAVEQSVRDAVAPKGLIIEKVYLVGEIRLPPAVKTSLDEKNQAFQRTLQREQEIQQSKAEAEKKIAEARGEAESVLVKARAQAEANKLVAASITPELVRYRALDKWNGELPRLNGGGAVPFIDVTGVAK